MKKLIFLMFYVPVTFSSLQTMLENYSILKNTTRPFNRLLTDMMGSSLTNIVNYGCWCYFGEDGHGKGRGEPVNKVDQYCKILHDGYQCIMMDSKQESSNKCVPWEADYTSSPSLVSDLSNLCKQKNAGDNCAIRSCIVENLFITSIFQEFISGYTLDMRFSKNNGFDQDRHCFHSRALDVNVNGDKNGNSGKQSSDSNKNQTPRLDELMCCGDYPYRFPHKIAEGKECCGSKAYDNELLQCCEDSTIKITC